MQKILPIFKLVEFKVNAFEIIDKNMLCKWIRWKRRSIDIQFTTKTFKRAFKS
jgi:hypothetical protein